MQYSIMVFLQVPRDLPKFCDLCNSLSPSCSLGTNGRLLLLLNDLPFVTDPTFQQSVSANSILFKENLLKVLWNKSGGQLIISPGAKARKQYTCCTSGFVCLDNIQAFSLLRDCSQTSFEFDPLHSHTCWVSLLSPHLGQASESLIFQCFINLPTPHIPEECLVIKVAFLQGTELAAAVMDYQSLRSSANSLKLPFFDKYALAASECMIVYKLS
jgi:hypothetical protein